MLKALTAQQLREVLNHNFGIEDEWPTALIVDHVTYANVCQSVFEEMIQQDLYVEVRYRTADGLKGFWLQHTALGPNKGIMFKGIELLLEGKDYGKIIETLEEKINSRSDGTQSREKIK